LLTQRRFYLEATTIGKNGLCRRLSNRQNLLHQLSETRHSSGLSEVYDRPAGASSTDLLCHTERSTFAVSAALDSGGYLSIAVTGIFFHNFHRAVVDERSSMAAATIKRGK